MNLFRVRGIPLAVHVSFFLLLAVNAYAGWADEGLPGLFWHTAALLVFFTCVVLHELGHSFTAMHFGVGVRRILLLPIGGMAEFEGLPREPRRELAITLAGPAVNFVIAALLWVVLPRDFAPEEAPMNWLIFGHEILKWNILMGCFNLLPAFPMDGGRIVRAALATRMTYLRATFWAVSIGKALCIVGFALAAVYEPMLMLLFGFIFFLGDLEYRVLKRQEIEDAHWKDVMARHYPMSPSVPEPPILLR